MSAFEKIIEKNHLINMDDIIREGNPTLRAVAEQVELPLSPELITLGEKMMEFLIASQNPEIAEERQLRGGVGLAATQLDILKRIIAVHMPSDSIEDTTPKFSEVMYNPKIIAHSVQDACLADGEGCLSVDREVQGYVIRYARITVSYVNSLGEQKKVKLKGYDAIVVQHEIDHLNGVMFYDYINEQNPFYLPSNTLVIE